MSCSFFIHLALLTLVTPFSLALPGQINYVQTSRDTKDRLTPQPPLNWTTENFFAFDTINILSSDKYQQIIGFGGALTEASAYVFSQLNKSLQQQVLDAYYGPNGHHYRLVWQTDDLKNNHYNKKKRKTKTGKSSYWKLWFFNRFVELWWCCRRLRSQIFFDWTWQGNHLTICVGSCQSFKISTSTIRIHLWITLVSTRFASDSAQLLLKEILDPY